MNAGMHLINFCKADFMLICMYVSMVARDYVCMYARSQLCFNACMYACITVRMHMLSLHVCMHSRFKMFLVFYACLYECKLFKHGCRFVYMHACVYEITSV